MFEYVINQYVILLQMSVISKNLNLLIFIVNPVVIQYGLMIFIVLQHGIYIMLREQQATGLFQQVPVTMEVITILLIRLPKQTVMQDLTQTSIMFRQILNR